MRVWVPGLVGVQKAGMSRRPMRVGRGVSRRSGRGPRSILRARLGPGSSEGRSSVRVGRGGGPGIPPEAGVAAPTQDSRLPSYLCRAPHRRSRAARTRARRRRARRAASGAAAAAAPGGRACCSRAAAGEPGRACSRRSLSAASWAAAAAWASATTSRASPAAAPSRRLTAPCRRPPRAGPHEAGGGPERPKASTAAETGRGGQRGRRGGGGTSAAGHRRKRPARARCRPDPPVRLPRRSGGPQGTSLNGDSPSSGAATAQAFGERRSKAGRLRSWAPPAPEPRGRLQCRTRLVACCGSGAEIVGIGARHTPSLTHSFIRSFTSPFIEGQT